MDININTVGDVTVIDITGEVDAKTAPTVQTKIIPLAQTRTKLLLKMDKVPYMSSAGLRLLLFLYRQVTAKDGQLVLVGLSEEIRDTMVVTGFLNFFATSENLESGLAALN
ncbi:anti-sigma factor antagonist [Nostoc sp. PCC 7107]|uniref:anti-sigma factor antagonist n=1 Tax=Nostoc sp. PCC 7107 TaxID=317936 RepID=UPI00029F132C|nr:anti-sigma factor antagonist [Nostoc sp. PCC 7107]AFY43775.1 anti-sigma-factor antagonist [Nostoc sp. PCC 7107]